MPAQQNMGKKQLLLGTVIYEGLIENYLMDHFLIVDFSGAKTLDLEHYMKPSLNNNRVDVVVILIGSNDVDFRNLRSETAVRDIAENIIKIALLCKECGISVVVVPSILPKRNIKLSKLIRQVNDILYDLCKMNNVYFLSNDNICKNFICDDGTLNQKGTHILASNFVIFINSIFHFN